MSAALAAVVGLAFIGKMFSDDSPEENVAVVAPTQQYQPNERETMQVNKKEFVDPQQYLENFKVTATRHKKAVESMADVTDFGTRNVFGQPVYDLTNRENVSNKMNNLNPNPWNKIGPGLGVGPNVPAFGGKQQLFRVLPPNMNEHRLTQLSGGIAAPPTSLVSGLQAPQIVGRNRPNKDIQRDPVKSFAVKTAAQAPQNYIKTGKLTKKDQMVFAQGDLNRGLPKFDRGMGYLTNPQSKLDLCDRRSKPATAGNPGSMNVRAGPLNSGGMVTRVRIDANMARVNHGRLNVPANYVREGIQEANPDKETVNPYMATQGLAREQLKTNPYNHPLV